MDPDRSVADDVEKFVRVNPNVQPPPPPPIPQLIPAAPQNVDLVRSGRPPVDKIRKHGAEDFKANIDDDPQKAEFWLKNSIRFQKKGLCGNSSRMNSEKKYISQRFIDQKRKEFLELKQGRMSVAEYEREFVRLSKYAQECVPTEAAMCKRFEDGLNEDIRIFVGMLELKEFVVLVDRACKAEELNKEKRKAAMEARDTRKRPMSKPFQTQSNKSKEMNPRVTTSTGYLRRDWGKLYLGSEAQATSVSSMGSMKPSRPECQHCGRQHPGECWLISRACFKCGSRQHYIKDCPENLEEEKFQNVRSSDTVSRVRSSRNTGTKDSDKSGMKSTAVKSEPRTPARAYAIRAREDASSPDVITGTFSLCDIDVVALIDPGSTNSYVTVSRLI
ncbi:uncharacterized protein LOC105793230 [Gossypium raimondii]|uniref:uncharacterized protein LOC105793230 n=1 Tax=Gossypium raimondii TaxID=29730 RepID=UPI00063A94E2|nr:uncharacterized protein LOC105793230 [Gossypium raimondii]